MVEYSALGRLRLVLLGYVLGGLLHERKLVIGAHWPTCGVMAGEQFADNR